MARRIVDERLCLLIARTPDSSLSLSPDARRLSTLRHDIAAAALFSGQPSREESLEDIKMLSCMTPGSGVLCLLQPRADHNRDPLWTASSV